LLVIPAKAGIQRLFFAASGKGLRKSEGSGFRLSPE
jgi:hypothetical protein